MTNSRASVIVTENMSRHSTVVIPGRVVPVATVEDESIFLSLVSLSSLVVSVDVGGHSSVSTMVPSGVIAVASVIDEGVLFSLVVCLGIGSSLVVTVDVSSDSAVVIPSGVVSVATVEDESVFFGLVVGLGISSSLVVIEGGVTIARAGVPSGIIAVTTVEDKGILFSLVALSSFSSLVTIGEAIRTAVVAIGVSRVEVMRMTIAIASMTTIVNSILCSLIVLSTFSSFVPGANISRVAVEAMLLANIAIWVMGTVESSTMRSISWVVLGLIFGSSLESLLS